MITVYAPARPTPVRSTAKLTTARARACAAAGGGDLELLVGEGVALETRIEERLVVVGGLPARSALPTLAVERLHLVAHRALLLPDLLLLEPVLVLLALHFPEVLPGQHIVLHHALLLQLLRHVQIVCSPHTFENVLKSGRRK
jgi:hypothetical protein